MTVPGQRAILLVEDEPTIREVIGTLLREEGYEVFEAGDGCEAIATLEGRGPPPELFGLVILDMNLPIADGGQVLATLAGRGNFVPVVAMSADARQLRRATAAGADEVMSKPFSLEQLLDVVERNCRS